MIRFEDWRPPIVEMVAVKQTLAEVDPKGIFPHYFPEAPASEEAVAVAERALNVTFDREYRSFLTFADGWKCFYHNVTLLSAKELVAGPLRESVYEAFEAMPELLEEIRWSPENLLPVAASLVQADIFLMEIGEGGVSESQVHWIAEGELIDTFETFGQFFVSMIDYTKQRVHKMREQETSLI